MGQKVSPIGLRLGINKTWSSRWFEDSRTYADSLHEDLSIRRYIMNYYYKTLKEEQKKIGGKKESFDPAISDIQIVRFPDRINIFISTARAGVVIGPKGQRVETVKTTVQKMVKKPVHFSITEIRDAELDANLAAQKEREVLITRAESEKETQRIAAEAQANVQSIEAEAKIKVAEREADAARKEAEGQADVEKTRAEAKVKVAESDAEAVKKSAEAAAMKTRAEGEAEADAAKAKALAEAAGKKESLLADAEGQKAKLLAEAEYQSAHFPFQQHLPEGFRLRY